MEHASTVPSFLCIPLGGVLSPPWIDGDPSTPSPPPGKDRGKRPPPWRRNSPPSSEDGGRGKTTPTVEKKLPSFV
eukprot:scaffold1671_cov344-Pavlova_lutheri.AAC.24